MIVVTVANLPPAPVLGASGGVFGLLLAFGMAYPRRELIIFPIPVPIQAWLAVTLYGAMELFLGVTRTASGIAHFAHLGGMATGFVMIRYWQAQRNKPRR
jgi:membrane associated rhomboid family serine protease